MLSKSLATSAILLAKDSPWAAIIIPTESKLSLDFKESIIIIRL